MIKYGKKFKKLMRRDFEIKPVYDDDDKYIKTKIKIYTSNMITNFHNKKMAKEKAPCKSLSIIMIYSVIKVQIRTRKDKKLRTLLMTI